MSYKRPNTNDSKPEASLLNVVTGVSYQISENHEFTIGRNCASSIMLEDACVSCIHCIIKYDAEKFILNDKSCSGTFLNCKRILNKINIELKHGDIIGIGEEGNFKFIYEFVLCSNSCKKPKLDEVANDEVGRSLDKYQSEFLKLNKEMNVIFEESDIAKLSNLVKKFEKVFAELKFEQIKLTSLLNLKNHIQIQLENEFQCPICNEIIVKACSTNCGHFFCDNCLQLWSNTNINPACPVCRSPIETTVKSIALDNYITKICDLLGGAVKKKRDNLVQERSDALLQMNYERSSPNIDVPPVIAFVDLTRPG